MELHHYGPHERQVIASYSDSISSEAVIFIHGGLWRDPTNTYKDWEPIINQLTNTKKIYSLDYRLSTEVRHPSHLQDVVDAINFVTDKDKLSTISIVGHSCGSTLAIQLMMNLSDLNITTKLKPQISNLILLDGIYNVGSFVEEYPVCEQYIKELFDEFAVTPLNFEIELTNWVLLQKINIVQSTNDELLSIRQSNEFIKWLQIHNLTYNFIIDDFGLHNQVYINQSIGHLILTSLF